MHCTTTQRSACVWPCIIYDQLTMPMTGSMIFMAWNSTLHIIMAESTNHIVDPRYWILFCTTTSSWWCSQKKSWTVRKPVQCPWKFVAMSPVAIDGRCLGQRSISSIKFRAPEKGQSSESWANWDADFPRDFLSDWLISRAFTYYHFGVITPKCKHSANVIINISVWSLKSVTLRV